MRDHRSRDLYRVIMREQQEMVDSQSRDGLGDKGNPSLGSALVNSPKEAECGRQRQMVVNESINSLRAGRWHIRYRSSAMEANQEQIETEP